MSISISIIPDIRRIKKTTGAYPVKMRVTIARDTRYYATIHELSQTDWKKLSSPRISEGLQKIRKDLQALKSDVDFFVSKNEPSEFSEFELGFVSGHKLFRPKIYKVPQLELPADQFDFSPFHKRFKIFAEDHSKVGTISVVFLVYIKKLLQEGRIGSAINYQRTYMSLKKFRGNVLLTEVSVAYLCQYEQWMIGRNASKSTVGIVLRPLRTIFNEAIEMGIIRREKHYPFGRRKYQIPTSRNVKKALDVGDIEKIYYYQPTDEVEQVAKFLWLFCYLSNGMNVKDMLHLKYRNIEGDYLVFERAKTERSTRTNPKLITVFLSDDIKSIINKFGNKSKEPNDYIFPIMRKEMTLLEQFDLLNFVRGRINTGMAQIAGKLSINKKITTIVSRHSFSTRMKHAGASTEFIQEALGHTDKKTTENYLDSFTKEVKKEYAGFLTPFSEGSLQVI